MTTLPITGLPRVEWGMLEDRAGARGARFFSQVGRSLERPGPSDAAKAAGEVAGVARWDFAHHVRPAGRPQGALGEFTIPLEPALDQTGRAANRQVIGTNRLSPTSIRPPAHIADETIPSFGPEHEPGVNRLFKYSPARSPKRMGDESTSKYRVATTVSKRRALRHGAGGMGQSRLLNCQGQVGRGAGLLYGRRGEDVVRTRW